MSTVTVYCTVHVHVVQLHDKAVYEASKSKLQDDQSLPMTVSTFNFFPTGMFQLMGIFISFHFLLFDFINEKQQWLTTIFRYHKT